MEEDFSLILANPQRIKGTPGRKTDQKDSEWLCQIGRLGLVSRSHIPSKEIQELRYLTRTRTSLKSERTQHKNRIHDVCQRANIKLTSYLSDIFGKTGRALLGLAMNGEVITVETVAPLLKKNITASVEELVEALNGCFNKYQLCELRLHFNLMDTINENIRLLDQAIEEITSNYSDLITQFQSIPGVKKTSAEIILAEVGAELSDFQSSKHFCSWAGMCPGSYESGGVRRTAHTGKGNKYLKTALYHCGRTASHSKSPTFSNFYQSVANRGSKQRAIIAVAHKILRIIYQLMSHRTQMYQEMGNALV